MDTILFYILISCGIVACGAMLYDMYKTYKFNKEHHI